MRDKQTVFVWGGLHTETLETSNELVTLTFLKTNTRVKFLNHVVKNARTFKREMCRPEGLAIQSAK